MSNGRMTRPVLLQRLLRSFSARIAIPSSGPPPPPRGGGNRAVCHAPLPPCPKSLTPSRGSLTMRHRTAIPPPLRVPSHAPQRFPPSAVARMASPPAACTPLREPRNPRCARRAAGSLPTGFRAGRRVTTIQNSEPAAAVETAEVRGERRDSLVGQRPRFLPVGEIDLARLLAAQEANSNRGAN